MTGAVLSNILSGSEAPIGRAELHDALDALLDGADAGTGEFDPTQFWQFTRQLAQARGIDREIEQTAIDHLKDIGSAAEPDALWKQGQWAILFQLMKRFEIAGVLPKGFMPSAFNAIALNVLSAGAGVKHPRHPDLWGFGTDGGKGWSLRMAAQTLLVCAVLHRKAQDGISEAEARRRVLPENGHPKKDNTGENIGFGRTWPDWKKRVAEQKGLSVVELEAECATSEPQGLYDFTPEQLVELWSLARPQPKARQEAGKRKESRQVSEKIRKKDR